MDLIAWTYDPLQAANAHLNFAKLGAVAREYHLDAYPGSSSSLHAGTPTDRLIAEWWLRSDRVVERLSAAGRGGPERQHGAAALASGAVCAKRPRSTACARQGSGSRRTVTICHSTRRILR